MLPSQTTGAGGVKRSLLDDVHERLAEHLADPDLAPGTPVRIDHLARLWGVSQTPVREALARAEAGGLVRREAHRGYRVAEVLPPAEFDRLMQLRLLLEPWCAARAAERADAGLGAALVAEHEAMRRAPTGHEYLDYLRADVAFHDLIVRSTGNGFLQAALDQARPHTHRFRRFGRGVDDAEAALREHQAVLDAVLSGDAAAAERAMRVHLEGVRLRGLADGDA